MPDFAGADSESLVVVEKAWRHSGGRNAWDWNHGL